MMHVNILKFIKPLFLDYAYLINICICYNYNLITNCFITLVDKILYKNMPFVSLLYAIILPICSKQFVFGFYLFLVSMRVVFKLQTMNI